MNKEEVVYNSKSLIETWLCNVKKVGDVWVEMCGSDCNDVYPCTVNNCGEVIGELLYDNNGKYNLLNFCGNVAGCKKIIGSIDILK